MSFKQERASRLHAEHQRLTDRLTRLEDSRKRLAGSLPADFSEQAFQRGNDQVVDELESGTRATLLQLEHALDRISRGLGEICEDCGQDISASRLAVLPAATRCLTCEEAHATL